MYIVLLVVINRAGEALGRLEREADALVGRGLGLQVAGAERTADRVGHWEGADFYEAKARDVVGRGGAEPLLGQVRGAEASTDRAAEGELLGGFEPRPGRGGTERLYARRLHLVGEPCAQRRFGARDHEIDAFLLGEGDEGVQRHRVDGHALRHLRDAGIARRAIEFCQKRAFGQRVSAYLRRLAPYYKQLK